MPMLCLGGTYRIVDTEPDGDSIRFYPEDPALWERVPGVHKVRTNATGGAQLRLDAIDALETHYSPPGSGPLHQPLDLAHQARDELVRWLGFRGVQRDGEKVTAATPNALAGYVLTQGADLYGRCVALAGRGAPPGESGTAIRVHITMLRRTANHPLIATGLAYPTFYLQLYPDLRAELAKQARNARPATGVWARDRSQKGVKVESLATLTDKAVILPNSSAASPTTSSSTPATPRWPGSPPTSPSAATRSSSCPPGATRALTTSSGWTARPCA
jgi:hypothetical protein